jgi:Ca-activated chloride channel family protein
MAALALLIIALAGPRAGSTSDIKRPDGDSLIVLLIDVSRSMAARDAVPDRLAVAVESAGDLVRSLGRDESTRLAVVAFAGRGVLRCPPTTNLGAVLDSLDSLRAGAVRPGGTGLADGLAAALDLIAGERQRRGADRPTARIVLFTDGEDLAGGLDAIRDRLSDSGVPVHAFSIGDDRDGHPIPVRQPDGSTADLTFRGGPVATRRRDALPAEIARLSGGGFLPIGLSRPDGLASLVRDRMEPATIAASSHQDTRVRKRADRSGLLVLAALACAAWSSFPRRWSWSGNRSGPGARVAAAIVFPLLIASDRPPGSIRDDLREGQRAYALGDLTRARHAFERAARTDPNNALAHANAAAVLSRLDRPSEALEHLDHARALEPDPASLARIDLARGNALARLGRLAEALAALDSCLAATSALPSIHDDARINREAVARLLPPPPRDDPAPAGPGRAPAENPGSVPESDRPRSRPSNPADPPSNPSNPERGPLGPEERLEAAVASIRAARDRRDAFNPASSATTPPDGPATDRRDW